MLGGKHCVKAERGAPSSRRRPKRVFDNQATALFALRDGSAVVNIKIFRNGNVQMTGLRDPQQGLPIIAELIACLRRAAKESVKESAKEPVKESTEEPAKESVKEPVKESTEEPIQESTEALSEKPGPIIAPGALAQLSPSRYQVCMINSDFALGTLIRRNALQAALRAEGYRTSFEPCVYPGVKLSYCYYSQSNEDEEGFCRCGRDMSIANKQACACRCVTVAIFQSGCVIITGAHTLDEVRSAQAFISRFVARHAAEVTAEAPEVTKKAPKRGSRSSKESKGEKEKGKTGLGT